MISLYPYQTPHAQALGAALLRHGAALDASDTGTGKTPVACKIASDFQRPTLVVCPKVVIPVWKDWFDQCDFPPPSLNVVNYEKLRVGNTPFGEWRGRRFVWNRPPGSLVIFDEVHRCMSSNSKNALMLAAAPAYSLKVLALSATIAEDPTEMRALAHVLKLCPWGNWWSWCLRNGCRRGHFGGIEFPRNPASAKHLLRIHDQIFPDKGSRMRIAELGAAFPDNLTTAEAYDLGSEAEIEAAYTEMEDELQALAKAAQRDIAMEVTAILRARQKIELLKAPGIVQMTQDLIAEGNSVVIFTAFRATLAAICQRLNTVCSIHGMQSNHEREWAISDFQSDQSRVIVVNIAAGGVGLSLHDLRGQYPRVALICPTDNAKDMRQALGRIHRAGAKSKAVQRLIFAAGTREEVICRRTRLKLEHLDTLNDGDFTLSKLAYA